MDQDGFGEACLTRLCDELLQVDSEWSVRAPDACAWWPHDLRQDIRLRPITGDAGRESGYRMSIETEVLRDVPVEDPSVARALNELNQDNGLSVVCLGDDGVMRLWCALRIFRDTAHFVTRWAAWLAACQAADALDVAEQPDRVHPSARRATSAHPSSGVREGEDDILGVRDLVVRQSAEHSAFLEESAVARGLEQLGREVERLPSGGYVTSQPWTLHHASAERWADHGELRTMAKAIDHWAYGPSLLLITWPAYQPPAELSSTLAMALNDMTRAEWSTATSLGTWIAQESEPGVAVRTVFPAAMAAETGSEDALTTVINLAQYQAQQCSDLPAVVQAVAPLEGKDPFVTGTPRVG